MSELVKISAVSYLNTKPFIYGIENSGLLKNYDLSLDIPSICASKLLNKDVDLGLVPVAIIPQLNEYHIVSDFCIGADGSVNTVMLYSDVPLNEINSVYLDYQSRTSVDLVRILAKYFWKISPEWISGEVGFEQKIMGNVAGVVIGDRAFNLNENFKFVYDLSGEWNKFTDLPFVFACWISNRKLDDDFLEIFNKALSFGLDNINTILDQESGNGIVNKSQLEKYYKNNISYMLSESKFKSLKLFLKYKSALFSAKKM